MQLNLRAPGQSQRGWTASELRLVMDEFIARKQDDNANALTEMNPYGTALKVETLRKIALEENDGFASAKMLTFIDPAKGERSEMRLAVLNVFARHEKNGHVRFFVRGEPRPRKLLLYHALTLVHCLLAFNWLLMFMPDA